MLIVEAWMDQIARFLNIPQAEVREKNFYRNGDKTHFGQVQPLVQTPRLWAELVAKAQYNERVKAVQDFNKKNRYAALWS